MSPGGWSMNWPVQPSYCASKLAGLDKGHPNPTVPDSKICSAPGHIQGGAVVRHGLAHLPQCRHLPRVCLQGALYLSKPAGQRERVGMEWRHAESHMCLQGALQLSKPAGKRGGGGMQMQAGTWAGRHACCNLPAQKCAHGAGNSNAMRPLWCSAGAAASQQCLCSVRADLHRVKAPAQAAPTCAPLRHRPGSRAGRKTGCRQEPG